MLSEKTKMIVKSTYPVLKEHGVAITTRMYERLFDEYPETKAFFENTRTGQAERLADAVLAYCKNIDNLDTLRASIEAIAKKHVNAKVKPEHYPIVGKVLLAAMQDVLGEGLSQEALGAWKEAYTYLADVFIQKEADLYNNS